jgi:hypothetical protein
MIDVVCVLWGDKYSDDYVRILKASVARNTTIPHRFVCLSDRKIKGVETLHLEGGLEGWWNKLMLFNSAIGFGNRIVYLDLDTVITGNIDFLLQYNGNFMGIENLGVAHPKDKMIYRGEFQSGVMAWDKEYASFIWPTFVHNKSNLNGLAGDGEFLNAMFKTMNDDPDLLQRLYPGKIQSFKYESYFTGDLDEVSIVCFHGDPRPHQAISETTNSWGVIYQPRPWIEKYWRL